MSTIRRQSIISSIIVYFGFALGFFNTWLFTREGSGLTKEQFGLTGIFIAFANIMFSVASLGMPAYIGKFFPYYHSHLPARKNDQMTWGLIIPVAGFGLVLIAGIFLKNVILYKVFDNSPQLLQYYYLTFLFGFGYTLFMLMEAFAWQHRKSILSNLLREVAFRLLSTILIVLISFHFIKSFDVFIALYSLTYLLLALYLLVYFYKNGQLRFHFSISKVTRRFLPRILTLAAFIWGSGLVFNIASVIDTIIIAAVMPNGMGFAGIFTLAQNITSLMQAPQRAIISASIGPLSQAWKEKNLEKIKKIYHHSSINQLLFATAMFCLIWLSFDDLISTFNMQEDYRMAKWVFFFLGLTRIIDMGTGINAQIISTSTAWRFDFKSGMILLALSLPLNWQLTRHLGVIGPAVSNLIAFTIYNGIRYVFLWKRFRMQPFNQKTLFTLLLAGACFIITWYLFKDQQGFGWIVTRSAVFGILFITGMAGMKLSPDLMPVIQTLRKRLRI